MTREERALKNLKQMCSDGRYLGSGSYVPLEVLEDFDLAIKALEQEPVIDKIKENIQFIKDKCLPNNIAEEYEQKGLQEALDIIDKYKAESDPQEVSDKE